MRKGGVVLSLIFTLVATAACAPKGNSLVGTETGNALTPSPPAGPANGSGNNGSDSTSISAICTTVGACDAALNISQCESDLSARNPSTATLDACENEISSFSCNSINTAGGLAGALSQASACKPLTP